MSLLFPHTSQGAAPPHLPCVQMEGMVHDLAHAKDKMEEFVRWQKKRGVTLPVELNATVLTVGFWPTFKVWGRGGRVLVGWNSKLQGSWTRQGTHPSMVGTIEVSPRSAFSNATEGQESLGAHGPDSLSNPFSENRAHPA